MQGPVFDTIQTNIVSKWLIRRNNLGGEGFFKNLKILAWHKTDIPIII